MPAEAVIAKVVISLIIMAASMAVNSILADSADISGTMPDISETGYQVNYSDSRAPLPRIYGRVRVGINRAYVGVSGTDNRYLHIIGLIGEGEIEGIAQTGGVDQIFLDNIIYTDYSGLFYYEIFTGTSTQNVCATLKTAIPEWNDPMRNTAYIYARIQYDSDVFQKIPTITLEVEGLKVYDPRTSTTAYSNNAALCTRDMIVTSSMRGGMGISSTRLDEESWKDSANYCDAKGWTIGMPVANQGAVADNIALLLANYRGAIIYSEGLFKGKYRDLDYEAVSMALNDYDIVDDNGSTLRIVQPSIFETPNAIRIKFLNSEKKYEEDAYVYVDQDALSVDGNYREETIDLSGTNSLSNAMKLAYYYLERLRINKSISFSTGLQCLGLEPLDLVTLTHAYPGWEDKIIRVITKGFNEGILQIEASEEDEIFYDDTYNVTTHNWHDTTLPDPSAAPLSVINVTQTEEVYYYRNRSFTRWKIDFDPPSAADYPWWKYAEIWIKIGSEGDWKYHTIATTDFTLDPVEEGVTYYCKIRSVSIHERKQAFDDAYEVSKVILGKTEIPSDLTALTAVASGDKVNIYADEISDPDIAGYEVRMGDSWEGGTFIGFNETPNIRLSGIRPGTFTFWMKAKDNSGHYSENPVSSTVTVFYPSGYVDKNTWSWDFNGIGTYDNTEHTIYDSSDCLRCSHGAIVSEVNRILENEDQRITESGDSRIMDTSTDYNLTGTWISPEYDLGSEKIVRVWGDFLTVYVSSETTWGGIFPNLTAWDTKIEENTKWYELTSPDRASIISAKIRWGTASGVYPNEANFFSILSPEFTARYLQIEVEITDPRVDSNLYLRELNLTAAYWE
jgi:hypothetical protein